MRASCPIRSPRVTLRELVAELVAIDSVNPDLVPGGAGELEIARFIAGWLERAGVEARIDEVAPGRANVIGVARGRGGGRTLLLNGHTDTVGHDGYERPLEPRVEGDRLYGRGSFDMKGGTAAALWACAEAAAARPRRATSSSPPSATRSSRASAPRRSPRQVRADAAIVTEPTVARASASRTRASPGSRSRSPAVPRTARSRSSASTRSPRPAAC